MRVFITGATGLVGRRLVEHLRERGDVSVCLSRDAGRAAERLGPGVEVVAGDPMHWGDWADRVAGCQSVVHLAGESIFGKRWSRGQKQLLRDSRVLSTENVVRAIGQAHAKPEVLVNASAIGYYGNVPDGDLTEDAPPGDDLLADICAAWEEAAARAEAHGVRVVRLRIGIVLAREGGPVHELLLPFKLGLGGPVGSGRQWMSWIHRDDLVSAIAFLIDRGDLRGAVNGTAPEPVRNREFGRSLGRALHRPAFLPLPAAAVRLLKGEAAYVIATGQRVLPAVLQRAGFAFRYPTCGAALAELFAR
jgi:uncharacterized protein (TIGR01777 family)